MSPQSAGPLLLLLPAMACGPAAPPAKQPPAAPTAVAAPPATGPCDAEAIEGELDANEAYGKTIERICVHGVPPEMNDDVRSYLRQKPGAVLTEGRLQYDLGSLFDSGFFARVDATARSTSKSTIELSFHLEPRPTVKSFRIDGASSLASDAKERNILREGASFDPANLHRDADNLRDQYLELGFERISITREITPEGATGVRVRLVVVEGVRNLVGGLILQGVSGPLEAQVQAASELRSGAHLTARDLQAAEFHVERFYSAQGYGEVVVRVIRGETSGAAVVPITISVQEGPRYRLGKLNVDLGNPAPEKEMFRLVQSKPNAPYDGAKLGADAARLTKALHARGTRMRFLAQRTWNRATKTADVVFGTLPDE